MASLSGPAPSTIPTARARKTAISETMWYLNSITVLSLHQWGSRRRMLAGRQPSPGSHQVTDRREEVVEARRGQAEHRLTGRCDRQGGDHRPYPGDEQRSHLDVRDPVLVEPRDALGVHELGTHPQPGEERAGHAGATLVEELHQRGVGADGDNELSILVIRQEHRDVLAGAGGREEQMRDIEPFDSLQAGGAPIPVGMHDDLRPAEQRLVGHISEPTRRTPISYAVFCL